MWRRGQFFWVAIPPLRPQPAALIGRDIVFLYLSIGCLIAESASGWSYCDGPKRRGRAEVRRSPTNGRCLVGRLAINVTAVDNL